MSARYRAALHSFLASPTRPKLGLARMRALLLALGNPHGRFPTLHIAGTKGKGSTSAFAAAMCRAAGLRVGLTTSPHLCTARERIVVDDELITEAHFADVAAAVERAARTLDDEASFFEKMIAAAFVAFAEAKVDVAVVEVGLGGRLDATNVITPRACAITRLGLDHTEHLGPTLEHIAREKAGILKPGVPAFTIAQEPAAAAVLQAVARDVGAPLEIVPLDPRLSPALAGAHQLENASLAAALVRGAGLAAPRPRSRGRGWGWGVGADAIASGARTAFIAGRYERIGDAPRFVLDGAHNETAAHALAQTLREDPAHGGRALELIVGMTTGHDAVAFCAALTAVPFSRVTAVTSRSPRTQPAGAVARAAARSFVAVEEGGLADALARARPADTTVVVTGSLYLVGEARALLLGLPSDPAFPLF